MYTEGSAAQDGVNSGTATERDPRGVGRMAASNLDTHSTWVGRGAHAVEFSKTAAPRNRRGFLLKGTPEVRLEALRTGPMNIARLDRSAQPRLTTSWSSSCEYVDQDGATPWAVVEVHQHDLLPCTQL
jgi:hypothetical protein